MKEKEPSIRRISLRKKVALSTLLLVSMASASGGTDTSGQESSVIQPVPQELFVPVVIPKDAREEIELISHSNQHSQAREPFLLAKERNIAIREEQDHVVNIMKAHPEAFREKYIEDVKIYYPIYKAVADKFGIDWYLLFIVHEKETGASAGKRPDSYYIGAMQRDPNVWPEEYVDKAEEGLEHLARLPQRREDDSREIAAAGNILADNQHKYENEGDSKLEAELKALLLYSADGPARERFDLLKRFDRIFTS